MILFFILISCDCDQTVRGTVIDIETKQPLKNILVYKKNDLRYPSTVTDSLGSFELSALSGGLSGCPPMKIIIEGEGYFKKEEEIPVQGNKTIELHNTSNYKDNWIYFELPKPTELKVISHQLAGIDCGTIATASVTIGVTNLNDTIRVFELCNVRKNFSIAESVIVTPAKRPSFNVIHPNMFIQTKEGELITHPYDLRVLKTTYGTIERKK